MSTSTSTSAAPKDARRASRRTTLRAHAACRDEIVHAPPPAALPAHLLGRRLRGRLLQLPVVRGARRRRLRRLRGGGRRVRSGGGASGCATTSTRPAARAIRPRPTGRSAAGCRRSTRCCASAASTGDAAWTSTPPAIAAASSRRRITRPPRPGALILAEGGNALEAMVAMAATIAAVYPHMNHIGGDGFWLVREPSGRVRAIDGARGRPARRRRRRSIASTATTRSRRAGRSRRSPCRARSPAGCWRCEAAEALSAASCRSTCCSAPAIRHAREGYAVTRSQARLTAEKLAELQGRAGLRRDVPGRRQAAGRRRDAASRPRSPRRSISSPMRGSTISTAAMSGARSPPIWSASARR